MRILAPCILLLSLLAAGPGPARAALPPPPPGETGIWRVLAPRQPSPLFYQAAGVAVGSRGGIFIADRGDHRVLKLSPTGIPQRLWGGDAPGGLYLSGPSSIGVAPDGAVYLSDYGIVKLSSSGRRLARWTGGALATASGVAVSRQGPIYALTLRSVPHSDMHDRLTVTKLSSGGKVLASWVFTYPQPAADSVISASIAVTPAGNAALSIHGQRFCHSCNGDYHQVWTLAATGAVQTRWDAPSGGAGFAIDRAGHVYLADSGRVRQFSATGALLATWGAPGCGPLQFGGDLRLAVGPDGSVVVADSQPVSVRPDRIVPASRAGVLHVLAPGVSGRALYGTCPAGGQSLFGQPNGVAVAPNGAVYVADEVTGHIVRISTDGRIETVYDGNHPSWIAADSRGNTYIADLQRNTVEKHAPSGVLLRRISGVAFEGAAIDGTGNIYGLTPFGQVQVLRPIGSSSRPALVRRWWLQGYRQSSGGLNATGIALDGHGNVYVTDTRFNRIQKFTTTGRLLAIWGGRGTGLGRLRVPTGISADRRGHLFILDQNNDRIQEWGTSGHPLRSYGREGQAPGQLINPAGIAVGGRGNVFVGDRGNVRIQELILR